MSKLIYIIAAVSIVLMLGLTACGGGGAAPAPAPTPTVPIGDAANGEKLFKELVLGGSAAGCATCHSLEPGVVIIGPSQSDLADRAATRIEGMSAADYIRQSILEPDAYIVEGFTAGLMPQNFGEILSEDEIDDIVAYTLTLSAK